MFSGEFPFFLKSYVGKILKGKWVSQNHTFPSSKEVGEKLSHPDELSHSEVLRVYDEKPCMHRFNILQGCFSCEPSHTMSL